MPSQPTKFWSVAAKWTPAGRSAEDHGGEAGGLGIQRAKGRVGGQHDLNRQRLVQVAYRGSRVFADKLGRLHAGKNFQQPLAFLRDHVVVDRGNGGELLVIEGSGLQDARDGGLPLALSADGEKTMGYEGEMIHVVAKLPLPQATVAAEGETSRADAAEGHGDRAQVLPGEGALRGGRAEWVERACAIHYAEAPR